MGRRSGGGGRFKKWEKLKYHFLDLYPN